MGRPVLYALFAWASISTSITVLLLLRRDRHAALCEKGRVKWVGSPAEATEAEGLVELQGEGGQREGELDTAGAPLTTAPPPLLTPPPAAARGRGLSARQVFLRTGKETCIEPELNPNEDPFLFYKFTPPPAECTVLGMMIEKLEPEYNFRRSFTLGYAFSPERKTHLLPYLRAAKDPSLHTSARRVYLDLGGNFFKTSVSWFMRFYPLDFTEVHVFEALHGMFEIPEPISLPGAETLLYKFNNLSTLPLELRPGMLTFPEWQLRKMKLYELLVGIEDGEGAIDITRFIKEGLRIRPEDALVVKMDIEDAEWDVLPAWLDDPHMAAVVDELFVEIHYKHPSMEHFHWARFNHTREQATTLLHSLRQKGFFVHAWP